MSSWSTPTASSPARPAWRLLVVAAVAALAVAIGVAAASFIATSRAAAVGAGASYVPATAPLYVEVRIDPSAPQDEDLRELLGRFPPIEGVDLDRPLFDQLSELLDEALADEGQSVRWSEDVAPWIEGSLAFALLEMPATAFDPGADPMALPEDVPSMVFLVGVSDPEAARTSVERLIDEVGGEAMSFATREHRGVTIHVAEGDLAAYAITEDQLLFAATADDIATALDARAGGSTLSEGSDMASLVAALPDEWLAFGVFDFTEAMTAALEASGDEARATSDALSDILEHQSMRSAFAVTARGDGLAFDSVAEPPTGPFSVENAERGLAGEVPGDALYYAEGGSIGPALAAVIGTIKEAAGAEPEAAEALATAEAALGAELEELVAWIDDGALSIGWDGAEPYGGMVLVPSDVDAAERRFDQLATFAGLASLDPSSGISVEEAESSGVVVTTIRWNDPAMMTLPTGEAPSLALQYALTDDRVIIGIGEAFVGRALDLDPAEALAAQARYADAVEDLGGPSSTGIGWMDIAGTVAAVEQALGPMLDDGPYRTEIRPWLDPFDRFVSVGRIEGDVLVQRSVLLAR